MANPLQFFQDVRAEAKKIVWPTRNETMVTTAIVIVMVVMACVFFVVVDTVIYKVIHELIALGRSLLAR